ncbi:MAG: DUF1896 family protein [Sediminibacterium sp.]
MTDAKNKLQGLLMAYIQENNPDLLLQLEEDDALHAWVLEKIREVEMVLKQAKPSYIIESECMDAMTMDLKPSKFNYIRDLFEEEFADQYTLAMQSGILRYEVINMIAACDHVFREMPLTEESMNDRHLEYMVTGVISDYLQRGE